jgi:hypothetical protein
MSQLWVAGLSEGYRRSTGAIDAEARPTEAIRDSSLGLHRGARLLLAVSELGDLARHHAGADKELIERVTRFVRFGRFGPIDSEDPARGTWHVRAHGDLHVRNVLVDSYHHVTLLDPANVDRAHWAVDWARLTADILLSSLSSRIEAYEWHLLKDWRELTGTVSCLEKLEETDLLSPRSTAAINWMTRERERIFAGVGEGLPIDWEIQLAFATELLRGAYRVDSLPPAIRVLALVAGADALEIAAAGWEDSVSEGA